MQNVLVGYLMDCPLRRSQNIFVGELNHKPFSDFHNVFTRSLLILNKLLPQQCSYSLLIRFSFQNYHNLVRLLILLKQHLVILGLSQLPSIDQFLDLHTAHFRQNKRSFDSPFLDIVEYYVGYLIAKNVPNRVSSNR